jgi:hypothetical protein
MRSRRHSPMVPLLAALAVATSIGVAAPIDLPGRLTDQEFWRLSRDLSEPDGSFQSDNLLSNEVVFGWLVPELAARAKPGGVYMGVGPEQNFTYIAATKPGMAFITDIRRGNLHLQLMYKALFEISKDRAEFVSRLFTKPRPATLTASSTVLQIMNAYWDVFPADEAAFKANLADVQSHLTKTRRIPLERADLDGIAKVYRAFYWYGPGMNYSARTYLSTPPAPRNGYGTYWAMMTQTDLSGEPFGYLASEERFAVIKDLQARNLVVPVVGNFSGPKALRAIGAYLKGRGATVSAFYLSNVESYLQRDGSWGRFCANVATLALDDSSVFIRPATVRIVTASPDAAAGKTRNPLRFLTFAPASPPPQGFQTFVVTSLAASFETVDSSALVPLRSSPPPATAADNSVRPAGVVPIKEAVTTCGWPSENRGTRAR